MNSLNLIFEYLEQGGLVSLPLLIVFIVITYTIGYRMSMLFAGRNLHVRELFENNSKAEKSVQRSYLKKLNKLIKKSDGDLDREIDWLLIEAHQGIHRYTAVLNTGVFLAPLLGLLGTVMGMIETFSSLSDTALFSSSGGIAGGISQALITTQFGLIIAIPGVFLSRYLKKVEKKTYMDLVQIGELFLLKKKEEA